MWTQLAWCVGLSVHLDGATGVYLSCIAAQFLVLQNDCQQSRTVVGIVMAIYRFGDAAHRRSAQNPIMVVASAKHVCVVLW